MLFLQDLQNEMRLRSLNQVFAFLSYENDTTVRGHEIDKWEDLCWFLHLPLFPVMRAISIVRTARNEFGLGVFHLIGQDANRKQLARLATQLYTDIRIDNGQLLRPLPMLIEHEREKTATLDYWKNTGVTALSDYNAPPLNEMSLERKQLKVGIDKPERHHRMLTSLSNHTFDGIVPLGAQSAYEQAMEFLPSSVELPKFDFGMLTYHLTAVTFARDESLYHNRYVTGFVANRRANIFNQLVREGEYFSNQ